MNELRLKKFFGGNLLLIMAFFCAVFQAVLLIFNLHYEQIPIQITKSTFLEYIVNYLNTLIVAGMIFKIVKWLNRKFKWSAKTAFIRTVLDFTIFTVLTISWILFVNQALFYLQQKDFITLDTVIYMTALGTMVNLFLVPIIELMVLMDTQYQSELQTKQLLHENTKYKYDLLKNQINPHFLFNSLSVLSPLISISQDKAKQYVNSFSIVLRHVLDFRDSDLISLKEEFKFLAHYIFLLKTRFGDAFDVEINEKFDASRKMILPMVLQLLIENVVKHNRMSEENPMCVRIEVKEKGIEVSNPIMKKSSISSWGIGLENIKMRYASFGQEIMVKEEQAVFSVFIPFISDIVEN